MGNWEWDWWKVRQLYAWGTGEWDWWKVRRLLGELGMGLEEGEAAVWGTGNGTGRR